MRHGYKATKLITGTTHYMLKPYNAVHHFRTISNLLHLWSTKDNKLLIYKVEIYYIITQAVHDLQGSTYYQFIEKSREILEQSPTLLEQQPLLCNLKVLVKEGMGEGGREMTLQLECKLEGRGLLS